MARDTSSQHGRAGFTLLEILMGAAVSSIVLLAVASAVMAVNSAYQQANKVSTSVENSRLAEAYLQRVLRYAGYGIDPQYAFDFTALTTGGVNVCASGQANNKSNCSVTFTGAPSVNTDDLAFRYRDPNYMRRGKLASGATTSNTFTVDSGSTFTTLGSDLKVGQPVIVACPGGKDYFVGKVSTAASASATTVAIDAYTGSVFPTALTTPPTCSYPGGSNTVTGTSAAYLFLLYEVRIRIAKIGAAGKEQPYLVAFHNLGSVDTAANADYDPIALGVEDFQVEYMMNRVACDSKCCTETGANPVCGNGSTSINPVDSGSSSKNWILGDDTSNTTQVIPDTGATPPTYATNYDDPLRFNAHPANIRAVRISVSVRQRESDGSKEAMPSVTMADHSNAGTPDGYYRSIFSTTIRLANMASHTFFIPPLRTSANDGDLDVWGG